MLTPYISLNRIYMLTEHSNKWGGDLMKCYLDLSDNQLKGFEVVGTDSEYNYLGAWSDEKGYRIVDAGIADEGDVVDWATNDVVANIGNTNLDMDYPTRTIDNNENRLWRITANNQITGYLLDGSMTSRTITLSQSFGVPAASGKARRLYIGDGYFYALIYLKI